MISPTLTNSVVVASLSIVNLGFDNVSIVSSSVSVGGVIPSGGVPVVVATFKILPLSTSACVTVYSAVAVATSPGLRLV